MICPSFSLVCHAKTLALYKAATTENINLNSGYGKRNNAGAYKKSCNL